jgi:hypothetical protein
MPRSRNEQRTDPGTVPPQYEQYVPELKRRWAAHAGGPFWDEIEPAFRFGWAAAHDAGLAGRDWAEIESDLADHWFAPEAASEEMAWDQVRDAVRMAWDLAHQATRPAPPTA